MRVGTLTGSLRAELAAAPLRDGPGRWAESAAIIRIAGALRLTSAGLGLRVKLGEGGVARRLRGALLALGHHPQLAHVRSDLHHQAGYVLELDDVPPELELVDGDGRPRAGLGELGAAHPTASLAGALMAGASLSGSGARPHLEVRAPGHETAADLAGLMAGASVVGRDRVVVKSGPAIGTVLASVGAHATFLAWDRGLLRRELRGDVNRVANADRANVRRSAIAAQSQVAAVTLALRRRGWDELPPDLREVALARLANPEATLAELAALLDPPVTKATVHRRLARLAALAAEDEDAPGRPAGSGASRPSDDR